MGAELHPIFRDLSERSKAEHLVAPAVGEDRPVPIHEAVEARSPFERFRPGAEIQVVRITEENLGAGLLQSRRRQCLYRTLSSDRHKCRGKERSMISRDTSAPRRPAGVLHFKLHSGKITDFR